MIAHVRGRILRKAPQEVVVDVAGVGYRLLIPVSTFCRLGEPGSETALRAHTHVRDDAIQLFGFLSEDKQTLFERLIEVAGVGPKLALNILSGIEVPELVHALRAGDVARLVRIPGVGKKTAERLVVELKDRLSALGAPVLGAPPPAHDAREDLVSALANLGYSRAEAERGVDGVLRETPDGRFEDLLRRSLRILSAR